MSTTAVKSVYVVAKAKEMLRMIKDGLNLTSREEWIFEAGKMAKEKEIKSAAKVK